MKSARGGSGRLAEFVGAILRACAVAAAGVGWMASASVAMGQNVGFVEVASGFSAPLFVSGAGDGSGRVFVVEQGGLIRTLDASGSPQAAPFLDISGLVVSGGERGLLGLAFHPSFASNGLFYVNYTRALDGATIVASFTATPPGAAQADASSERVILGPVAQPQENHNGGMIAFGPDGDLYIGLGDGGSLNDQGPGHNAAIGNGQDPTTLLGKILRIDVDYPAMDAAYGIPADNPFASGAGGARREIYAYGLRNPWRFSFDFVSGRLLCGDVGQGRVEEIDVIQKGGNYGWRRMEGSLCFNPSMACQTGALLLPIYEYDHTIGCSVTGGYVYRGARFPSLAGLYFFGDFCEGRVAYLREGPPDAWTAVGAGALPAQLSSFGRDDAGELYLCGHDNGAVYRLVDSDALRPLILSVLLTGGPIDFVLDLNRDGVVDVADLLGAPSGA